MKKIYLQVVQNDLIEKAKKVVFAGLASIKIAEDYHVLYVEKDMTKVELKLNQNQGFLARNGEAEVRINFDINKQDTTEIKSSVGSVYMETKTDNITLNKDNLLLEYKLLQNGHIVGDFKLKMEWKDESN